LDFEAKISRIVLAWWLPEVGMIEIGLADNPIRIHK